MGRRYYSRRYYSNDYYTSSNRTGFFTSIFYVIFFPIILLYRLIKFIIKLNKKNKLVEQRDYYKPETPHVSFYRDADYDDIDENKKMTYQQTDDFNENKTEQTTYQQKDSLITNYEKYFYNILEEHFGNQYKIQTQVNLASIVKKVDNSKYQNELFRNIDFGIFEKSTLKPLLMIEINDSTHKNSNRYQRDLNVRKILEESDIKLITFYSSYQNKQDYVIDRITKELNDK